MKAAARDEITRRLAALGYQFGGTKRQKVDGKTLIAAVATPVNRDDGPPPVSVAALSERTAVTALIGAAKALA